MDPLFREAPKIPITPQTSPRPPLGLKKGLFPHLEEPLSPCESFQQTEKES